MTIEDLKKATIDDAKELVSLANHHSIDMDIYDLEADACILADLISDLMKASGIEMVYNFIKDAAEGHSPFALIDGYGCLEPFRQPDLDCLRERLCEEVFPDGDAEILEAIEEASRQKYSIEGVQTLKRIEERFGIPTHFDNVSVAGESVKSDPPEIYTEDDFCRDCDDLVAELRNRLTDITV